MDASRWRQIRQLFDDLIDEPPARWQELLEIRCPDDPELQRDVLAMLQADADEQTGPVVALSVSAPALLDELVKDHETRSLNEWIGRCLGPWRITALIGSGGMGLVYLAERVDGNFDQRAAIKVMRAGADTESVMRRFREERQILAGLVHPNIAGLLDGGVDDQGVPWFAMEYVDGQPITEWCAQRGLDVKARLKLFLDVCAALAHAHQHLVVHRDLKPQNVLVDAEGRPKLLDFGIAKLLDDADGGDRTGTAMRLMTPDYAAPEQIRGDAVTTAVDVYALGLLLFELLTGGKPYRRRKHGTTLSTVNAVLHDEPLAPSAVVGRHGAGVEQASSLASQAAPESPASPASPASPSSPASSSTHVPAESPGSYATAHGTTLSEGSAAHASEGLAASNARAQAASPSATGAAATTNGAASHGLGDTRRLRQQLRGDLDAIVLKALRKDPQRRYRSVTEFAADVRAHLELRPVAARQGNRRYRVTRFVRRHASAVAFASLAVIALVVGLAGTLRYAQIAQRERTAAIAEARKAETTADFLRQLFVNTDPAATDGEDPRASELLERGRQELMATVDVDDETRAALLTEIANAFLSLDQYEKSLSTAREADESARGAISPEVKVNAAMSLGNALMQWRRNDDALVEFERARSIFDAAAVKGKQMDSDLDAFTAIALSNLDRNAESLQLLERSYAKAKGARDTLPQIGMIELYAMALTDAGRLDDAVKATRYAYETYVHRSDLTLLQRYGICSAYGHALLRDGRPEDAEGPYREALDFAEQIYGVGHASTASAHHNISISLRDQGRYGEAARHARTALSLHSAQLPAKHPRVRSAMVNTGIILSADGKHRDALLLLEDSLRDAEWVHQAGSRVVVNGFIALVHSLRATGQIGDALDAAASGLGYEADNLDGAGLLSKWTSLRLVKAELENAIGARLSAESCQLLRNDERLAALTRSQQERAWNLSRRCPDERRTATGQ